MHNPSPILTGCLYACLAAGILTAQDRDVASDIRYFDSQGVKIAYIDVGQGEPVVFVHGFAINLDIARGLCQDFVRAGHRFIALDARGHGRSGKPHDTNAYGTEMADDIARLLNHLKLPKAHVIGYSMGGAIANKFRERHPNRLWTVTLGGVGRDVTRWTIPDLDVRKLAESLRAGQGVTMLIRAAFKDMSEPQIEKMNADIMRPGEQDPLALAAVLDAYSELNVSDESLKNNTVPTLVIVGEKAGECASAEAMAKVLTKSTLVIIPGADHMQTPAHPQFLDALLKFVAAAR